MGIGGMLLSTSVTAKLLTAFGWLGCLVILPCWWIRIAACARNRHVEGRGITTTTKTTTPKRYYMSIVAVIVVVLLQSIVLTVLSSYGLALSTGVISLFYNLFFQVLVVGLLVALLAYSCPVMLMLEQYDDSMESALLETTSTAASIPTTNVNENMDTTDYYSQEQQHHTQNTHYHTHRYPPPQFLEVLCVVYLWASSVTAIALGRCMSGVGTNVLGSQGCIVTDWQPINDTFRIITIENPDIRDACPNGIPVLSNCTWLEDPYQT